MNIKSAAHANDAKLRELVLYICYLSEGDNSFGKVKLNKILFYADFLWQLAGKGETIPYSVALVGLRQPTEAERAMGLELESLAKSHLDRHAA